MTCNCYSPVMVFSCYCMQLVCLQYWQLSFVIMCKCILHSRRCWSSIIFFILIFFKTCSNVPCITTLFFPHTSNLTYSPFDNNCWPSYLFFKRIKATLLKRFLSLLLLSSGFNKGKLSLGCPFCYK